jgi:transcriptional regulator with XRE-family HTH domain
MHFYEKLSKKRRENNLSQEQLADKLDVSRQSVSKWESGLSYPDMDKIIQLCKIFNCSLDDLIDDDAMGNKDILNNKKETNYFNDFLNFITQICNMFTSMKNSERWKCFFEEIIIIIIAIIIHSILGDILSSTFNSILYALPNNARDVTSLIFTFIYDIVYLILSVIVIIHIFKVRYLNYYVTVEDKNIKQKTIEEPIKENKVSNIDNPKEKIIIRDPDNSSFHFFKVLENIFIFIIKVIAFFLICLLAFLFVLDVVGITFLFTIVINSIIFLYFILVLVGILGLLFEFIWLLYSFMANKKVKVLQTFIILISSIAVMGIGFGLASREYLNFSNSKSFTKEVTLDVPSKAVVLDNYHYVIDNSTDKMIINYTYNDYTKDDRYYFDCREDNYCLLKSTNNNSKSLKNAFNYFISTFKEKKAMNVDYVVEVNSIRISQANYDLIENNKKNYYNN